MSEEEALRNLLKKVDVAVWCWAVKTNTIPSRKISVDWKGAFNELQAAYYDWELAASNAFGVLSQKGQEQ